jgi:hypothetical protein
MDFVEQSEKSQLKKKDYNKDQIFPDQRLQDLLVTGKNEANAIDSKEDDFNPYMIDGREVPDSMKPYMDKKGTYDYDKWQQDLHERQLADAKKHGVPSDNMVEEYEKPQTDRTTIDKGQKTADERYRELDKNIQSGKEHINFNINDNREKKGDALPKVGELKNDESWKVRDAGKYIENNDVKVFLDKSENFKGSDTIAASGTRADNNGNYYKYIKFNEDYVGELSDKKKKAIISHEVGHLKGGDEVQAWLDEAQTGYSVEAHKICFRLDEQQKTYNEIKHDLISRYHYVEKNFDYQ